MDRGWRRSFLLLLMLAIAGVSAFVVTFPVHHEANAPAFNDKSKPADVAKPPSGMVTTATKRDAPLVHAAEPPEGPTFRGPKIGTKHDFDAAVVAADRGDAVAARELALTTRDCTTILYKFDAQPPSPESMETRLQDFAKYEAARYTFCRQLDRDVLDLRGKWMADAAKAGDRYAVLNLRFYPPMGRNAAEEREAWSALVLDLLLKAGDDPEALSALGRIYLDGVVVSRDLDTADHYLQRAMGVASPDSNEYKFAVLMRDRLKLLRSRNSTQG